MTVHYVQWKNGEDISNDVSTQRWIRESGREQVTVEFGRRCGILCRLHVGPSEDHAEFPGLKPVPWLEGWRQHNFRLLFVLQETPKMFFFFTEKN